MATHPNHKTGRCPHHCPAGSPCCLERNTPATQHTLHVCQDAGCECHSEERYEWALHLRQAVELEA